GEATEGVAAMIDCVAMQEQMPGVARGLDAWSVAEGEHLAGCAECALEWRLVRAGAALHARTTVDGDRIAQRVTARLRVEPAEAPIRRLPWRGGLIGLLAAAASVALVVWAPGHQGGVTTGRADTTMEIAALPELQSLNDGELEAVLRSLGPSAADATPGVLPHLEDLTDSELEQLLRSRGNE
ncbi:MAG: hypothetical protein ABUL71_03295, partial [Gemmatimonadota bacterium]